MKLVAESIKIGDKTLTLEVGRFANQANAAVLARLGDTMVLATVVSAGKRDDIDYFPLYVEYIERLYAGGRIKGSRWVKREGRPSDEAVLTARLIDRSVRPLFPEGFRKEVQIVITVLSVDAENPADIPAICAASAALAISDIPWAGPVGAARIGFIPETKGGQKNAQKSFLALPTDQDLEYSDMNLVISGTERAVIMVEAGANGVPEKTVLDAFKFAQEEIKKIIQSIKALEKKVGKKKQKVELEKINPQLVSKITKDAGEKIGQLTKDVATKIETRDSFRELIDALTEKYVEEKRGTINKIVDKIMKKAVRDEVLKKGKRIDGRKPDEVRPIEVEVGLLPRTHGSAMFKRGNTQALTVTTLGSPSLEQLIESMTGEETKRYIHHYSMPPFSVGETGRMGWPSRREIGHGSLAERALEPVIPSEEKFPYTIRLVSEIMSSNGSTSMASVCGSTLSLMDAGVPIAAPVTGIAMGMISDGNKQVILTDILGVEDFNGDMDFKVAGTKEGITALQMDVKTLSLTPVLLAKALEQARVGRLFILEKMLAVLPSVRKQLSQFAPKIKVVKVPVEKIGQVIGPGGKMIRRIIEETGATVDVEDDGSVNISAPDEAAVDKAVEWVKGLTKEVEVGEIFEGTVKRILPFGAFVELAPSKEGLVHVSKMATRFIKDPNDVVKIGQKVKVQVREVDDRGRINLTMIFGQEKADRSSPRPRPREPRRPRGFSRRR